MPSWCCDPANPVTLPFPGMANALSRTYYAPFQTVFDTTISILPSLSMRVVSADPTQGLIVVSANMSLMSWGENVTIRMGTHDNVQTTVSVDSIAKVLFTYGKNQRNVEKILDAISRALPQPQPPA